MANKSVLNKPRNLKEDVYDLTDEDHPHFDGKFYKSIIDRYGSLHNFFNSDLWDKFLKYYREKYEKENGKENNRRKKGNS